MSDVLVKVVGAGHTYYTMTRAPTTYHKSHVISVDHKQPPHSNVSTMAKPKNLNKKVKNEAKREAKKEAKKEIQKREKHVARLQPYGLKSNDGAVVRFANMSHAVS